MINAYNYLVSSNCYKPQVKYTAHKKNELKIVQNEVNGYKTRIKGICAGLLEMLDKME